MGLRGPNAKPVSKRKPSAKARKVAPLSGTSRFERVVRFIERLPITSGLLAGTTFKLRPWQREIVKAIYRTDRRGHRIVRQVLLTLPRKQGKTGLTAALALAHLCGPEAEPRGQVYSAAADRAQAALLFNEMKAMIEQVPALEKRIIVRDFNKTLEDAETGSIYQALSADAKTKHGFSASCWIYDELAQAPDRKLYDVLATSTAARKEPLGIVISTQSSDPHSIMAELVDYGLQVRDGVLEDPHFLPIIYTAPEDADPWDEATWHACNPALGDFRSLEEMRSAALQAQRMPAREPAFRLLYLNQRVSSEARFIAQAEWEGCAAEIDVEALRGRPCWAGLDKGSTTDLTALVLYFPDDGGAVLPWFWVPRDRLEEREHTDKVPYPLWHRQGFLEAPEGRAINNLAIIHRLAEIASMYDVRGLAYDRWRLEDLKKLLDDEGIDLPITPFGQGFRDMAPAVDALEAAILNRTLRHPMHPVLTWNAWNARVAIDPTGARKIDKAKSTERVDGIVALAMAVGLHARAPVERTFTVPESLVITA
ncbi:MAG: terminase large subunit [Burkholderiales bacterium]|nr:terminase large subunit [Burkholderiales bacterium]